MQEPTNSIIPTVFVGDMSLGQESGTDTQMQIGQYVLIREIGQGAMARVWRAWDPKLERYVAIKEPLFDVRLSRGSLDDMMARFVREGRTLAGLAHPGLVTVYAADVYQGRPAIVMELVEGQTLSEVLKGAPLEPSFALDLLDQLLDAVDYIHDRGIVHRDIKPSNIFLTNGGRVKLADFGIAHVIDADVPIHTLEGSILGTPGYMSPEQVRGQEVDARSDLFSIGTIGYEMVAGFNPFGATDGTDVVALMHRIAHEPVPELPLEGDGIPSGLRGAIMQSLEKDPSLRMRSAADFKAMLHEDTACNKSRHAWSPISKAVAVAILALILALPIGWAALKLADIGEVADEYVNENKNVNGSGNEGETAAEEIADDDESYDSSISRPSEASDELPLLPTLWEGSYEGHSLDGESYVQESRIIWLDIEDQDETGSVVATCSISGDSAVHGRISCSYRLEGTFDSESREIELVSTEWIDQGGFTYMRDFSGILDESLSSITGVSKDHGSGLNPSQWTMSAVGR